MKTCPQCNAQLPDQARFCLTCGTAQAQITGDGAIAQNQGVAAGPKGVAVSGGVHGGVSVTEVHYHGYRAADTATPPRPRLYHNLPHPDYGTFVGREGELAKIHQLLLPYPRSRYHIITVDGIGGIGKSALALEAAYRYVHTRETLPQDERFDAIIWISAKQAILTAQGIISRRTELYDLNDVYTTIATTLESQHITQARVEEQSVVVACALARQRTLLIIDNLEMVNDERVIAFIREVPDPTKVIVTTRQRIDVAHPIRLVEMPWEDARGLIAQECEKKDVVLTDEQARKLYDRTGGVPLALVWSIARVALGDNIANVLQRLARPDSDIARFCFEGVVQPLRDNEPYRLLVASALFAQDAQREALRHAAGIQDELSCSDGLIALERLSLLNRQADRFSLLPLTRSYLDHELKRMPQFAQAALERMLVYYKRLVTPPPEVQMGDPYWDGVINYAGFSDLELEWTNLYHVIRWTLDKNCYADALDLFLPTVHFLSIRGSWDDLAQLSREMCQVARRLQDPSEAWLWIDTIGWIHSRRQQVAECLGAFKTGRELARQSGLVDALILADAFEASMYTAVGDTDLARRRLESALKQVELDSVLEHKSRVRQIVAVRVTGAAAALSQSEGDLACAKEWFERELGLRRSLGANTAPLLARLGRLSLKLDDVASAERFLAQASDGAGRKDKPLINYGLALIAEQKGEVQEARYLCKLALEQFAQLGVASGVQDSRQLLA